MLIGSLPAAACVYQRCGWLADEPGVPGRPEATDWDKDFCDLKWDAPDSDGGAPITGYVVEKKEKGSGKWVKAVDTRGK